MAPEEMTVEFGMKMGGETGVIIAKGTIRDPRTPGLTLNVSAQLGSHPATLDRVQEIIAAEPEFTDVGTLGPWWFRRVALADPGAFVMRRHQHDSRMIATGLIDVTTGSGAWLETHYHLDPNHPDRLIIHSRRWARVGGADTLTRLQRYSTHPHGIELANLEIQITTPGSSTPTNEPPHWELDRRGLVLRLWNRR